MFSVFKLATVNLLFQPDFLTHTIPLDLEAGSLTVPHPPTESSITSSCPTAEPNVYVELPLIQSQPTSVTNEAALLVELRGQQSDKLGALDGQ